MSTRDAPSEGRRRLPGWSRSTSIELARRRRRFWSNSTGAVALGVLLLLAPQLGVSPNSTHEWALTALYVITVMGLNLVFGLAGQVTLGPAATFAVGAYAGGLLADSAAWNPITAIPAAVAIAVIAGLIIGVPALRIGGFYLAMVTVIAALAIPTIVDLYPAQPPTGMGGEDGISVPLLHIGSNTFTDNANYRLVIVVTLVCALLVANIARNAWGRWFECLKISPIGTDALGVSVYRAKVTAFALSAAFGGLRVRLYSPYEGFISPLQFGFSLSTAFFVAVVIGGLGPRPAARVRDLLPRALLPAAVERERPVAAGDLRRDHHRRRHRASRWGQRGRRRSLAFRAATAPVALAATGRPQRQLAAEPTDGRSPEQHRALSGRTATELPPLLARAGAAAAGEPVLVAEGVHKRFGGIVALDGAG